MARPSAARKPPCRMRRTQAVSPVHRSDPTRSALPEHHPRRGKVISRMKAQRSGVDHHPHTRRNGPVPRLDPSPTVRSACRLEGSRDRTATAALASRAAATTARAAPPVPATSHAFVGASSRRSASFQTSLRRYCPPTTAVSSPQKVLHAPNRWTRSLGRVIALAAVSLWGMVTFPPPPASRAR